MIYISHRGNIDGKKPHLENHPDYIDKAIALGYDVEVDLWEIDGELFLGHDEPQYPIDFDWLEERSSVLWIHCKNVDALLCCVDDEYSDAMLNYFWHEEDTLTLTSFNWIWAYPGKQPIKNSIAVMPERTNDDVSQCNGICSDVIKKYKDEIKQTK
jgi:hypothetical protein